MKSAWPTGPTYPIRLDRPIRARRHSDEGGLYNFFGVFTLINCTFTGNSATQDANYPGSGKGGAIALYFKSLTQIDTGNVFTNNSAGYGGGAIGVYEDVAPTIDGNTFTGNQVDAIDQSGTIPASDRTWEAIPILHSMRCSSHPQFGFRISAADGSHYPTSRTAVHTIGHGGSSSPFIFGIR